MRKSTIVHFLLLVIFIIVYCSWDSIIKTLGHKLPSYQKTVNEMVYSPDKRYYVEIWVTSKFTSYILNMQKPGFVRVYDTKTKKKIVESKIFDIGPSTDIIWPCREGDYLNVGNESITNKISPIRNCYATEITTY